MGGMAGFADLNAYARGASLNGNPALVLNADYIPLSYFPLSVWPWQGALKAVFLDRVNIIAEYDRVVRSPSVEMRLPSVVCLRQYVKPVKFPAFTRFNLFLRDEFRCQYCGEGGEVTFDHVVPRSAGRAYRVDQCGCGVSRLQSEEGPHDASPGRNAALASPLPPDGFPAEGDRPAIPAEPPA